MKNSCCTKPYRGSWERSASSVWIPLPATDGVDRVGVGTDTALARTDGPSTAPLAGAVENNVPAATASADITTVQRDLLTCAPSGRSGQPSATGPSASRRPGHGARRPVSRSAPALG